jgi:hypothetical protein
MIWLKKLFKLGQSECEAISSQKANLSKEKSIINDKQLNLATEYPNIDFNSSSGFEFLFRHDEIYITADLFDKLLSPESIDWDKIEHEGSYLFTTRHGAISYSFEMAGIQMTFTKGFDIDVARKIAHEVLIKVERYNKGVQLIEISDDEHHIQL